MEAWQRLTYWVLPGKVGETSIRRERGRSHFWGQDAGSCVQPRTGDSGPKLQLAVDFKLLYHYFWASRYSQNNI